MRTSAQDQGEEPPSRGRGLQRHRHAPCGLLGAAFSFVQWSQEAKGKGMGKGKTGARGSFEKVMIRLDFHLRKIPQESVWKPN